jgi:hypothetical protein
MTSPGESRDINWKSQEIHNVGPRVLKFLTYFLNHRILFFSIILLHFNSVSDWLF